ncbi:hypothetical protein MmiEs2_11170 [Methanimicrococcus stummii]|uniref:Putative zinc-ribbon domain-containing protein n=1 Tax=Methanimicrococcus stummii TaxID=3028294 RepID=A0AA96V974_9EURY|nr:zinc ribbon domain-containing protein [Methanimicrococcus sp. Es2]WNY28904.1 hypothetical protein MmiEs2_11170 [Methanimicrococcus sp. Es2]
MGNNFCSNCGESVLREDAKICYNCGARLTEDEPISSGPSASGQNQNYNEPPRGVPNYNAPPRAQYVQADQKSPFIALLLSFFWVGLGQLYNGKFWKGILFQISFIIGLLLLIPGLIVWFICLWDAYNDADKMNKGLIPFANPSFGEIIVFIFFWIIVFVVMIVIFMLMMIPLAFI